MSREAHFESVAAAIEAVGEVGRIVVHTAVHNVREMNESIAQIAEKQQEALGLIVVAVGEDPATNSGRNSIEFMQVLGSKLEDLRQLQAAFDEGVQELARIVDNDVQELNNYLAGW